jgi:hypothetical protein
MNALLTRICFGSCIIATACVAHAQHHDVFVTRVGTQTGIGAADVDNGAFDLTTRVFEGVLVASASPPDYSRDEPGFFALSSMAPGGLFPSGASALPGNTDVAFSFNTFTVNGNSGNLFYWDGAGAVDFQPVSSFSMALNPAIVQTEAAGDLDFHPDFELDDPSGTPANGVYLVSVSAQADGIGPSDPVYFVWLADATITSDLIAEETEEDIEAGLAFTYFEEAAEYVESHVVIPEPDSMALVALALGALAVSRKRRD